MACEQCGYKTSDKETLDRHMERLHSNTEDTTRLKLRCNRYKIIYLCAEGSRLPIMI